MLSGNGQSISIAGSPRKKRKRIVGVLPMKKSVVAHKCFRFYGRQHVWLKTGAKRRFAGIFNSLS